MIRDPRTRVFAPDDEPEAEDFDDALTEYENRIEAMVDNFLEDE